MRQQVKLHETFESPCHRAMIATKMRNRYRLWLACYVGVNRKLRSKFIQLHEESMHAYVIEVE